MAKKRTQRTGKWELGSEALEFEDGRSGYTDLIRTTAPAWDWFAEGGALGPIEGTASSAAEARERVEQALGLRPLGKYVSAQARAGSAYTLRAERAR